jgi:hypothetical protein
VLTVVCTTGCTTSLKVSCWEIEVIADILIVLYISPSPRLLRAVADDDLTV